MQQSIDAVIPQLHKLLLQANGLRRAIATGKQRHATPPWRRIELRPVVLQGKQALQVVTFDKRQSHTRNLRYGIEATQETEALLRAGFAHWHVEASGEVWQVRLAKGGKAQVHRAPAKNTDLNTAHNREKTRLLPASDALWAALGMACPAGNIKPTAQQKFRQVDAFLRLLDPVLDSLGAAQKPVRVVDLGCGNAALTFAAYRHVTHTRKFVATFTGIDVSDGARARNAAIADSLGYQDLHFIAGSIAQAPVHGADVVLALHACDTATDEALARGIGWRARAILAAPCCHHDVQKQLKAQAAPSPYGLVARHGILSERLADVLTDGLRAALLRNHGYRTEVIEFIESQHTPRNTLLRAVYTGAPADANVQQDYDALVQQWNITPALATLLK